MSTDAVNVFCHRLTVDVQHRELAQRNLAAALSRFDLTPAERGAIETGDVSYLYEIGVHPLLLVRLQTFGIAGLTEATYSARIRVTKPTRDAIERED